MNQSPKEKAVNRVAEFVEFAHAERVGNRAKADAAIGRLARLGVVIQRANEAPYAARKEATK